LPHNRSYLPIFECKSMKNGTFLQYNFKFISLKVLQFSTQLMELFILVGFYGIPKIVVDINFAVVIKTLTFFTYFIGFCEGNQKQSLL